MIYVVLLGYLVANALMLKAFYDLGRSRGIDECIRLAMKRDTSVAEIVDEILKK